MKTLTQMQEDLLTNLYDASMEFVSDDSTTTAEKISTLLTVANAFAFTLEKRVADSK